MTDNSPPLYFFGWPSNLGGASTKVAHLLCLLAPHFRITLVPPSPRALHDRSWMKFLNILGVRCALWKDLPQKLEGWAMGTCDFHFLKKGLAFEAKDRGLKVAWSNDMMGPFPLELQTLTLQAFDAVIYVSDAQRVALEPLYRAALGNLRPEEPMTGQTYGEITGIGGRRVRWVMTGNYIDPEWFAFRDRFRRGMKKTRLTVGRLSRSDPAKFPADFPEFYEGLGLKSPTFRVMGWSNRLAWRFRRHSFGPRWDLLPPMALPQEKFLQSLDLFVYSVGSSLKESWGRVVVEAMLTGAVPVVQKGAGHMELLLSHGESGFLCESQADFGMWARELEKYPDLRRRVSFTARDYAVEVHCNPSSHLALWKKLFV